MCLGNRFLISPGYFFFFKLLSVPVHQQKCYILFRFVIVLRPPSRLGFFLPNIYVDTVMTVRKNTDGLRKREKQV